MTPLQKDEAIASGFPEQRLFLLPQGVHTSNFLPVGSAEEQMSLRQYFGLPVDKVNCFVWLEWLQKHIREWIG